MKTWAVIAQYVPNAEERRKPHREAHLAYARELHAKGQLVSAGAFQDPIDSALLVYKAETRGEVYELLARDPYVRNGLWVGVSVREWAVVVPQS